MSYKIIKQRIGLVCAGIALFITMQSASAAFINGTLIMGGVTVTLDESFQPTDFESAAGLFFTNAFAFQGDGDFAGVIPGTPLEFNPFLFEPTLFPNPVTPLWHLVDNMGTPDPTDDIDFFGFNLNTITINEHNENTLSLSGTGSIYGAGFDETPGNWNFTAQPEGVVIPGLPYLEFFSFSAASSTVIPEAKTVVTFSIGMIALMVLGYRRRLTYGSNEP